MDHRVMGVIGASGGLGASTLAVALAVRAGPHVGATVAVDGALAGGALDVTACLEHLSGVRWPDLAAAQGGLDGAALLRVLPAEGTTRILAGTHRGLGDSVVRAALAGLARVCGVVVVDLGRSLWLADQCTELVLVAGTSARHLADATAVADAIHELGGPAGLVVRTSRGDPVTPEEVAVHLDLPLMGTLRDDSRIVTDADRARMPGSRSSGALAAVAAALLSAEPSGDLSVQQLGA
jgi:Flp pilus assembly CpaE family ATPase